MRKAGAIGGAVIAAAILGLASFAAACTNFARVDAINPPADAPRSEVTVRGAGVGPNALVQLRWNALDGQVIGSAAADVNGAFSVKGAVPADAAPGVYSILAVALSETVVGQGQVIVPTVGAPQGEVSVDGRGAQPGLPVELRWNAPGGQGIGAATADAKGAFSVKGAVPAEARPGVYSVIAVSVGTSASVGVGRAAFEVTAPLGTTATPSLTGAYGVNGADSGLWKGFAAGGGGLDSPSATDLPTRLGLGVLAVGLVALAGGAAVAATRRRRVTVSS